MLTSYSNTTFCNSIYEPNRNLNHNQSQRPNPNKYCYSNYGDICSLNLEQYLEYLTQKSDKSKKFWLDQRKYFIGCSIGRIILLNSSKIFYELSDSGELNHNNYSFKEGTDSKDMYTWTKILDLLNKRIINSQRQGFQKSLRKMQ